MGSWEEKTWGCMQQKYKGVGIPFLPWMDDLLLFGNEISGIKGI